MKSKPLLEIDKVSKVYSQGTFKKRIVFQLKADITLHKPTIVGMMGPNGAGKSTFLKIIAGQIIPTSGKVICDGQNIHKIKYNERNNLVKYNCPKKNQTQKYNKSMPNCLLRPADNNNRKIYLYDELDLDDGLIGLLQKHFYKLRQKGHLVVLCCHPSKSSHLEIIHRTCEHFIFVYNGKLTQTHNLQSLLIIEEARNFLGSLIAE